MDHRDRGRGELAPHERQDSDGWGDPASPWPGDPYSRPDGSHRTPSRRRARHRGAPDPVDSYTPPWALESTPPSQADAAAGGGDGGRHHQPDPAGERGAGRRRAEPDVGWEGMDEYWRAPRRTSDEPVADGATDNRWRGTGETVGWRRAPDTGADDAGTGDVGATGRHGRNREDAGRHADDTTGGWPRSAPVSGAAPISGAGERGSYPGESPERPGRGRRRRADPEVDGSVAPTSGWGGGASAGSWTERGGLDDSVRSDDGPRRHRTGTPGAGWRDSPETDTRGSWHGRTGEPDGGWRDHTMELGAGSRGRVEPDRTDGRPAVGRRRARPESWDRDDPSLPDRPAASGTYPRDRAGEDAPTAAPRPGTAASAEPPPADPAPEDGMTKPTARWVRSATEADPRAGTDVPPRRSERRAGRADGGARPWEREPDAEPVRRDRDTGPVRRGRDTGAARRSDDDPGVAGRPGDERGLPRWQGPADSGGGSGRHANPAPDRRRLDTTRRSRHTDPGPWDQFTDTGMLEPVTDAGPVSSPSVGRRRDRSTDSSRWDQLTDTGMLEPVTDAGPVSSPSVGRRRDRSTETSRWDRFTDTTEWRNGELAGLAGDAQAEEAGRTGVDRDDAFWSGTRLAGDDPRWMGIPDSAPRSPAVAYPPPARPAAPARRRQDEATTPTRRRSEPVSSRARAGTATSPRRAGGPDPVSTGRRSATGRRPTSSSARRQASPLSRRLEDDLLDPRPSGPLTAVLYTAAWYGVAVLAVFVWVLTLDASVPVDCVPGAVGGCESERGQATAALLDGVPRFAAALATGLVVAALMRWLNRTWRAVTVGLAASVVGGGLSTVLFSVISGRPLGG
ncbi:hypothetical protein [Plantactinospora soyae]|uniref:Uncharacterized protein n=1 Tax=Plantactinospora soyae TaxID=1544732 RepID=A0A927M3M8_9ACTN|nr:hypothetical protein [Plantactinospora soyae]MBE1486066.1 hypothetical protein [Plantactinospora soyae]